jgi:hypothetical protein
VLRDGGRVAVNTWVAMHPVFVHALGTLRTIVPGFRHDPAAGDLHAPETLRLALLEVGFRDVEVTDVERTASAPSAAAVWSSMQRVSPPVVVAARGMGAASWRDVAERVDDALRAAFGAGAITSTVVARVAVAVR